MIGKNYPKHGENLSKLTKKSTMTQEHQQSQHPEMQHYNVINLFKRLAHKEDLLHLCYNENQNLKMLMGQTNQ